MALMLKLLLLVFHFQYSKNKKQKKIHRPTERATTKAEDVISPVVIVGQVSAHESVSTYVAKT